MAPLKRPVHHITKNKGITIDIPSTDSQSFDSPGQESSKSRLRSSNWTEIMDSVMLNLMTEEHALGNFVTGSFTPLAWTRMVHAFNERTKFSFAKGHLQNRLKVLKRQYMTYQTLANKSGWGWDYTLNIPTAGDPSDWDAIIAENPAYAKCRDKPFPSYQAIEFLSGKATATGKYGFTTAMDTEVVHSTSSSSPATRLDMTMLAKNLEVVNDANSTSPTTTPAKKNSQYTNTASGHTSSVKRPRLSPPKNTPTSSRRKKVDVRSEAIYELVEIGRKRMELAQNLMQREFDSRPKVISIEECMERLGTIPHLSPHGVLAACEAFKDDRNRSIFMMLSSELLYMWIERQVVLQGVIAGQNLAAPSVPSTAPSFVPNTHTFTPAASTFPPITPPFTSNVTSFPSEGPSFPPN